MQDSPYAYPGHYVIDGECCACGRKPGNLEYFGSRSAELYLERERQRVRNTPEWTDDMIRTMPKSIQNMIRRVDGRP